MNRSRSRYPRVHGRRRANFDAEEADLLLEMIRHVLRSMIVPHREAACDALGEAAEVAPHALTDRFQRLEAGCPRIDVSTPTHSAEFNRSDILAHQPKHPPATRSGLLHVATVPRPCDGLRHGTGWRRARHGSPPSARRQTSRRGRSAPPRRWWCVGPRRRRVAINPGSGSRQTRQLPHRR